MRGYVYIPKHHRDSDVPAPEISIADKKRNSYHDCDPFSTRVFYLSPIQKHIYNWDTSLIVIERVSLVHDRMLSLSKTL